ncbi:four helix bundle protein [Hymenobacter algoricola]|uniref:Four helix bundle protein n=1 Tax=Hymenobacter algoricola TaxID=486267 RepID=A0ABP7NLE8_9BACT
MRNYQQLLIWQKGMDLVEQVYLLVASFPAEERFGLRSQLTRAATSISSNIAEGSSRGSEKDYKRFIEIALGSAFEVETQLLIITRVGLSCPPAAEPALSLVREEQMMLQSFLRRLGG